MPDDPVRTAIIIGVAVAVLGPLALMLVKAILRGLRKVWDKFVVPWVLAPIGDRAGAAMRERLIETVDEEFAGTIARAVTSAIGVLDDRVEERLGGHYERIEEHLTGIRQELTINGGSSVKDIVLATSRRVETIDREVTTARMEQEAIWATLSANGIDRRRGMEADDVTTEIDLDDVQAETDGADGGY